MGGFSTPSLQGGPDEQRGEELHLVAIPGDPTVEEAFTEAAKHDITVLPYIGHGPFPIAGTKNAKDWVEYAEAMVKKYGPGSSFSHPVKTWEIWNEPNMPFGSSPEFEGSVNPEGFAEFLKEMSEGLRLAAKGEIQILAPGLYGYRNNGCHPECHLMPRSFLKRMDQKLAELEYSNAYDAISLHPYIFTIQAKKGERKHAPRNDGDVKRVSKAIKGVITAAHSLKPNMPLWITELGFPVAIPGNKGDAPPVTNPIQEQLVRATFSMMQNNRKRLNIAKAFYYTIQDQPLLGWEHHSGLLTVKGKARPAWTSYSNLAGGKPCPHLPC